MEGHQHSTEINAPERQEWRLFGVDLGHFGSKTAKKKAKSTGLGYLSVNSSIL
jgi:hypothetical protein